MIRTRLRGGVVGCGAIVNRSHMPGWRALKEDVEIVAVCDQDNDAATATARRFAIPGSYQDFSHMLEKERLDFIDICAPPATHLELAIPAMKAGLHVLIEKPMATTLGEADEIVSASRVHNVKLCVAHNILYSPVVQAARSLIANGAIGDLMAVEIESLDRRAGLISRQSHWCHSLPGGVFGEYAPHPVYIVTALLGSISRVKAIARKFSEFSWVTADHLNVLFEAENGVGALTMSFNSPRYTFKTRIFGTEGLLDIDNCALTMTISKYRGYGAHALALEKLNLSYQMVKGAVSSSLKAATGRRYYKASHQSLMRQFISSVRDDLEPPVTGEDGRETIRVLEEIWKQLDLA